MTNFPSIDYCVRINVAASSYIDKSDIQFIDELRSECIIFIILSFLKPFIASTSEHNYTGQTSKFYEFFYQSLLHNVKTRMSLS